MNVVIYYVAKLLTYPAALIKALWEHIMLRILRIRVEDVRYMQRNELCGHVEHGEITSKGKAFWFCLLPGFINLIIALPMLFIGAGNLFYLGVGMRDLSSALIEPLFFVYIIMYYLSVSMLCNLFPLYEDAMNMWDKLFHGEKTNTVVKILTFIPAAIIYAGAFLERYGINLLIAVIITALLIFV